MGSLIGEGIRLGSLFAMGMTNVLGGTITSGRSVADRAYYDVELRPIGTSGGVTATQVVRGVVIAKRSKRFVSTRSCNEQIPCLFVPALHSCCLRQLSEDAGLGRGDEGGGLS